jgi:F0F1-type ATP synthase beta subunit
MDQREKTLKNKSSTLTMGTVVSVRGSVVDIWFDAHLPPMYSLLDAKEGHSAIRDPPALTRRSTNVIFITDGITFETGSYTEQNS